MLKYHLPQRHRDTERTIFARPGDAGLAKSPPEGRALFTDRYLPICKNKALSVPQCLCGLVWLQLSRAVDLCALRGGNLRSETSSKLVYW